ncbi:uncharacterized protein FOMMEDRAFT_161116 [Fomitiporia mediterranea MF3/22]|uniref:uncharacterized protein n=1 Tax=Fomitiporia mediterranea (strain MF3/22) TaxID=694068 RepID=UPI0004408CED|nr:uncharacterized protein FOMMEDRAFT_161116 [Fomitiporia mediterranea MF3/22]EJC98924.1 hypothetical protein FOMMEDRAFT_161116 [Fomitiporia mediterranea MF3/22]
MTHHKLTIELIYQNCSFDFPTNMDSSDQQKSVELLRSILKCLENEQDAREQRHKDQSLDQRRDSFAQICSIYSVIAIFIATLGVGFLSYMHDIFVARPEDTQGKLTDQVITMCLFLSVLLSISSSIALGAGASPSLITSLPEIQKIVASADPRSKLGKIQRFFYSKRNLSNCSIQETQCASESESESSSEEQVVPRSRLDTFLNWMVKVKALPSNEFQFVIGLLLISLLCMFDALVCMAIAVMTFGWAEMGLPLGTAMTVSIVFPLAVVGCVAVIYRFTLSGRQQEGGGHGSEMNSAA